MKAGLIDQVGLDRPEQLAYAAAEGCLLECRIVATPTEEAELASTVAGGFVLGVLTRESGEVLTCFDAAAQIFELGTHAGGADAPEYILCQIRAGSPPRIRGKVLKRSPEYIARVAAAQKVSYSTAAESALRLPSFSPENTLEDIRRLPGASCALCKPSLERSSGEGSLEVKR